MNFNFFYTNDAVLINYFRVPKILFSDPKFNSISAEAKLLYSILLDLTSLSIKNNWKDENNRIYVYFTIENTQKTLNCCKTKAIKLFTELQKANLILRIHQGLNRPSKIFVYNFAKEITCNQFNSEFTDPTKTSRTNSFFCRLKHTNKGNIDEHCSDCFNINLCPFPLRTLRKSETTSKSELCFNDINYLISEILQTNDYYNFDERCDNGVATHLEYLYFQSEGM